MFKIRPNWPVCYCRFDRILNRTLSYTSCGIKKNHTRFKTYLKRVMFKILPNWPMYMPTRQNFKQNPSVWRYDHMVSRRITLGIHFKTYLKRVMFKVLPNWPVCYCRLDRISNRTLQFEDMIIRYQKESH